MLKSKQINHNPRQFLSLYSDFVYNAGDFTTSSSGTGSSATYVGNFPGRIGVLRLATGSTAGGWSRIGLTVNSNIVYFDVGNWVYRTSIMLPVLSNATDAFHIAAGFVQQTSFTANQITVRAMEGIGNFELLIRTAGNADIIVNTQVPVVANTWYAIELEVNNAGTEVVAKINSEVVAQVATTLAQLPTTNMNLGQFISNLGGVASTRILNVDYAQCICRFYNPR